MLELYLLLGLAGVGYVISTSPAAPGQGQRQQRSRGAPPPGSSANTVYDSTYSQTADAVTRRRARDKYLRSTRPPSDEGGVMSRTHNVYSSLSGVEMPAGEFSHNNMTPFLSGSPTQNMNFRANDAILENFAGASQGSAACSKRETTPMFAPRESAEAPLQNVDDFWQSRMVPGTMRNNEVPVQQVRVGPGLSADGEFGAQPNSKAAGYEDLERELTRDKTIDELRSVDRPKLSFGGRMLDGSKTPRVGRPGRTTRQIVPGFKANTVDDMLPTSATNVKDAWTPLPEVRDTNRMAGNEYVGAAGAASRAKHPLPYCQQALRGVKPRMEGFGVHNAVVATGTGTADDYGRGTMYTRANERMATGASTPMGNVASGVQAMIAPLLDMVRPTRKSFTDSYGSAFARLQPMVPDKPTVHDPNMWVARTTIKETNIHDSEWMNLKGAERSGVYDPDDPARMTLRQTLTNAGISGEGNLHGNHFKGKAYDPDEVARVTVKQTTERNDGEGNVDAVTKRRGGYQATPYEAAQTQRQALADHEYFGDAARTAADGYKVASFDARPTQKHATSQRSHIGTAQDTSKQTPMSYDDVYNASLNDCRQHLLRGRVPTTVGAKRNPAPESVHQVRHKPVLAQSARTHSGAPGHRPHPVQSAALSAPSMQRPSGGDRLDDRLDSSVLRSLDSNPYHIDIRAPATPARM